MAAVTPTANMDVLSLETTHLYQRSLLKNDNDYGFKAFLGTIPGFTATDTQRCRALRRTIVELALAGVEKSINAENAQGIAVFLKVLEDTKLQGNDLINETNIAHLLFGSFYRLHSEARESNPALVDPNHSQFHGDFGRQAFYIFSNGPDKNVKFQAITEVLNALKTAWKIS